jgi:hypothetical protein
MYEDLRRPTWALKYFWDELGFLLRLWQLQHGL